MEGEVEVVGSECGMGAMHVLIGETSCRGGGRGKGGGVEAGSKYIYIGGVAPMKGWPLYVALVVTLAVLFLGWCQAGA